MSLDEFKQLNKSISWAAVIRSYMESGNRGNELKPQQGDESKTEVKEILKSVTNLRLEAMSKTKAKQSKGGNELKKQVRSI